MFENFYMLLPHHVTLVILTTSELLSGCFNHIRINGFGLGFGFVRVPHIGVAREGQRGHDPQNIWKI